MLTIVLWWSVRGPLPNGFPQGWTTNSGRAPGGGAGGALTRWGEVWLLASKGDFRDGLPLQVEICDLGADGLGIRHGDRLVLTVVESRRSGP